MGSRLIDLRCQTSRRCTSYCMIIWIGAMTLVVPMILWGRMHVNISEREQWIYQSSLWIGGQFSFLGCEDLWFEICVDIFKCSMKLLSHSKELQVTLSFCHDSWPNFEASDMRKLFMLFTNRGL